jgi:hypothetical protein
MLPPAAVADTARYDRRWAGRGPRCTARGEAGERGDMIEQRIVHEANLGSSARARTGSASVRVGDAQEAPAATARAGQAPGQSSTRAASVSATS